MKKAEVKKAKPVAKSGKVRGSKVSGKVPGGVSGSPGANVASTAGTDGSGNGVGGSGSGRSAGWRLLAAPLVSVPDAAMLSRFASLNVPDAGDDVSRALAALKSAAGVADAEAVGDDYQELFIGLGRGKVVPYGSWHIAGALMDRPLARLRADLRGLGFARREGVKEPEDHAGALCETLAFLADDESATSFARQKKFFDAHIAPWLGGFFGEVSAEAGTDFYREFGTFGSAFAAFESRYFAMPF